MNPSPNQSILKKTTEKKEFSDLPEKDVEKAFENFDKPHLVDEEKIKKTRDLLRKVFSSFASRKLFSLKNKEPEWILRKHLSTRERLEYYEEIYGKILKGMPKKLNIIDLGAGINGFSYNFFKKLKFEANYLAVEAIGQLVGLMDYYFKKSKIKGKAIHLSLFELEKIKELIQKIKSPKIIFLFKTLDSLEMIERDYSKKLLLEIVPFADKVVVSFATRSMHKREKFAAKRTWLVSFINENFKVLDDFELGGERYLVFRGKN